MLSYFFYPFSFIRSFVPASFFFVFVLRWRSRGGTTGDVLFFFPLVVFSQVYRLEYDRMQYKLWLWGMIEFKGGTILH